MINIAPAENRVEKTIAVLASLLIWVYFFKHSMRKIVRKVVITETTIYNFDDFGKQVDKTIIFVSHDERNIKDICNRAVLLEKGRLLLDGEVNKVFNEYNLLIKNN